MRIALLTAALMLGTAVQPPAPRVPVVVELFTSEGCSSCPPADTVLSGLMHDQPVPGAEIIALGMHVDYWDDQGWKDPASSHQATMRQQAYSRVFGADRVYTPQAVIDGRDELVGSDNGGVKRAIARAAARPHAHVGLTTSVDGATLVATVSVAGLPTAANESLDAVVAILEDGVTSAVQRGENRGRTLHHDAVVRAVQATGLSGDHAARVVIQLPPGGRPSALRAVAFVQGRKSARIWGAAFAPIQ